MKLLFLIATRNRPKMLLSLLREIYWQTHGKAKIIVVNDASQKSYNQSRLLLNRLNGTYIRLDTHHGKKHYYKVVTSLLQQAKGVDFDFVYKLDDDIKLHPQAIQKSTRLFQKISDPKKITLNLWVDHRADQIVWTGLAPRVVRTGGINIRKVGWIDGGNWMGNKKMLKILNYKCPKPPPEWHYISSTISSGVGKMLSKKILMSNHRIYMPMESLIYHGSHQSQMHTNKENRLIEMDKKPWNNE